MGDSQEYYRSNVGWCDEGHYPVEDAYSPDRIAHLVRGPLPPAIKNFVSLLNAAANAATHHSGIITSGMVRAQLVQLFMKNDLAHGNGYVVVTAGQPPPRPQ
jgi:hypothetical protein